MPGLKHQRKPSAGSVVGSYVGAHTELRNSLTAVFHAMLGRDPDTTTLNNIDAAFGGAEHPIAELVVHIWHSPEFRKRLSEMAPSITPDFIHGARVRMIEALLPAANNILDLGGANSPLYEMGYRHQFKRYVLVDLPADQRCDQYREIKRVAAERVSIHYGDMADLSAFSDETFDLVWSGQSIEHISIDSAVHMLREVHRVLTPDGHFCLDTPNRLVTRVQMAADGGGFIHPEHKHEYTTGELRHLLESSGFNIVLAKGLCSMPSVTARRVYDPVDFVRGQAICDDLDDAYIQFYSCVKER